MLFFIIIFFLFSEVLFYFFFFVVVGHLADGSARRARYRRVDRPVLVGARGGGLVSRYRNNGAACADVWRPRDNRNMCWYGAYVCIYIKTLYRDRGINHYGRYNICIL